MSMLYQLHIYSTQNGSSGYMYFSSKREAEKEKVKEGKDSESEIKPIQVEISKAGILNALNHYASHADNG